MSLSTKEDIQSLMANYRDVEMEKERAFIVNGNSPMETEPPVHSPSMSSPLASHISNSILDSHTPPNPSAESPSSHSDESSPDVSMSLENAPSSSAIPPPLSDVRILNRINHRAIPPRLFVATNTFTFSNTPLLYTHKPPSSSSSSSRSPNPIRPSPFFAATNPQPAFPPLSNQDCAASSETASSTASTPPFPAPAPASSY